MVPVIKGHVLHLCVETSLLMMWGSGRAAACVPPVPDLLSLFTSDSLLIFFPRLCLFTVFISPSRLIHPPILYLHSYSSTAPKVCVNIPLSVLQSQPGGCRRRPPKRRAQGPSCSALPPVCRLLEHESFRDIF